MAYTPDEGELLSLQRMIAYENIYLRLFTDNHVEDVTESWSDFTEAAGGGYVQKTLTSGSWSVLSNQGDDGVARASYAKQTWTFTGALTSDAIIYGWVLVGVTSGKLYRVAIESAFTPTGAGDFYEVTPVLELRSRAT